MAISLHLDENVHLAIAEALRRRGLDVTTPKDAGLIGASDEEHLQFAQSNGRVVVTHDSDFLRLHVAGAKHAGIAFCHVKKYSLRELIRVLSRVAISQSPEAMAKRVEYI